MILYLTIAIIIWLALTCVYFINDAATAWDTVEGWRDLTERTGKELSSAYKELQKWKRPRARNGRFK